MNYDYIKYDENGKVVYLKQNDYDGSITGHIVIGVKQWFDENPEERKRLGWIKHIHYSVQEIREALNYNPQTEYLTKTVTQVDEYTVEDVYHALPKSEEMLLLEEMLNALDVNSGTNFIFTDDAMRTF